MTPFHSDVKSTQQVCDTGKLTSLLVSLTIFWISLTARLTSGDLVCESHDSQGCEQNQTSCSDTIICQSGSASHTSVYCYTFFHNGTNRPVLIQGCWLGTDPRKCRGKTMCEGNVTNDGNFFCCCDESMCNSRFSVMYDLGKFKTNDKKGRNDLRLLDWNSELVKTLLATFLPLFVVTTLIIMMFWLWRKHKWTIAHEVTPSPVEQSLLKSVAPPPCTGSITLLNVHANGRYGCVWKARMGQRTVAVKVFPLGDRDSWEAEQELYSLSHVADEPNILKFIAAETHMGSTGTMEHWLVSEFHELGSLYDYLKGHRLSYQQLLSISYSMCSGLAFLHSSIPDDEPDRCKPPVAHRDFKSKNVLLKDEYHACIADFGLTLPLRFTSSVNNTKVGTHRYMSPEVLDGATDFSIMGFIKIDIYACSLVLWELLSRYNTEVKSEYKAPFEDIVGSYPSIDQMHDAVCLKKLRPTISSSWRNDQSLMLLCETIEDCWDEDPEARLTAESILQRLSYLQSVAMTMVHTKQIYIGEHEKGIDV